MISVSIGAGEITGILIAIVGMAWALLKIVFNQFDAKQESRFQSVSARFETLEKKVSAIDSLVLEVKKLEIEQLRRDNQYSEKFVTKVDSDANQVKHDKVVDRIFTLLQQMNDKLDNKMNKNDCDIKCRTKDRGE